MEDVSLIIAGGTYLTFDKGGRIVPDGALAIRGREIAALGTKDEITSRYSAREVIDASHCLVLPGLINGHTHAAMTCFRGIADDLPLMEWLKGYIFPAEAKNVNPELVYWGTMLAAAEMIRSGTTTFSDMYLFEDEAARAVKQAGMRCLLGEGLFDFPSPNAKTPAEGLAYAERLISKWRDDPLINIFVTPHSLYTCSADLLRQAKSLARRYDLPLGIHLLENEAEKRLIREKTANDALSYLLELGLLDERLIAYHCVALDEGDMDLLAARGASVITNPESNMKLASGAAPVARMIEAGIKVGLGTDGCASNNNLDMFQEMDSAAKLSKVTRLDPTALDAATVLKMATKEGAAALGFKDVGTLEAGKKADIIIVDLRKPHLTPLYREYSQLVYSAGGADVETVIIDGRVVMKNRRLLTIDEVEAMARVNDLAEKVKASLSR